MSELPTLPLSCAYWTQEGIFCRNPGLKTCANCRLVVVCIPPPPPLHSTFSGLTERCSTADRPVRNCTGPNTRSSARPAWRNRIGVLAGIVKLVYRHGPLVKPLSIGTTHSEGQNTCGKHSRSGCLTTRAERGAGLPGEIASVVRRQVTFGCELPIHSQTLTCWKLREIFVMSSSPYLTSRPQRLINLMSF